MREKGFMYFAANWALFAFFGVLFHIAWWIPFGDYPSGFRWLWDMGGLDRALCVMIELILWYVSIGSFIHAYRRW